MEVFFGCCVCVEVVELYRGDDGRDSQRSCRSKTASSFGLQKLNFKAFSYFDTVGLKSVSSFKFH